MLNLSRPAGWSGAPIALALQPFSPAGLRSNRVRACGSRRGADEKRPRNEYTQRSGARARSLRGGGVRPLDAVASPCPPVAAGQIYRFIDGIDACMTPMAAGDLAGELNDPWGALVLRKNAGGAGPWPGSVADVVHAMAAVGASNQFQQFS